MFSLDTAIGILALLVGIGSYIYTWHFNRYSVDVGEIHFDNIYNQKKIDFRIVNTSTKPLSIDAVTLSYKSQVITDTGFSPANFKAAAAKIERQNEISELRANGNIAQVRAIQSGPSVMLNYDDESENFEDSQILAPGSTLYLSYFVKNIPDQITITANHQIHWFKRTKSFPTK